MVLIRVLSNFQQSPWLSKLRLHQSLCRNCAKTHCQKSTIIVSFFTCLLSYEYIMHKQVLAILCIKSNETIFQLPYPCKQKQPLAFISKCLIHHHSHHHLDYRWQTYFLELYFQVNSISFNGSVERIHSIYIPLSSSLHFAQDYKHIWDENNLTKEQVYSVKLGQREKLNSEERENPYKEILLVGLGFFV